MSGRVCVRNALQYIYALYIYEEERRKRGGGEVSLPACHHSMPCMSSEGGEGNKFSEICERKYIYMPCLLCMREEGTVMCQGYTSKLICAALTFREERREYYSNYYDFNM